MEQWRARVRVRPRLTVCVAGAYLFTVNPILLHRNIAAIKGTKTAYVRT
ncbi:hypothetical protein QFZ54_003867 [Sphingomonas faeni]|nr:hypothetical protein [Sphingomonas faeni]